MSMSPFEKQILASYLPNYQIGTVVICKCQSSKIFEPQQFQVVEIKDDVVKLLNVNALSKPKTEHYTLNITVNQNAVFFGNWLFCLFSSIEDMKAFEAKSNEIQQMNKALTCAISLDYIATMLADLPMSKQQKTLLLKQFGDERTCQDINEIQYVLESFNTLLDTQQGQTKRHLMYELNGETICINKIVKSKLGYIVSGSNLTISQIFIDQSLNGMLNRGAILYLSELRF